MHPQVAQPTHGADAGHDPVRDPGSPGHSTLTGSQAPPETSHDRPGRPQATGQARPDAGPAMPVAVPTTPTGRARGSGHSPRSKTSVGWDGWAILLMPIADLS